MKTIGIDVDSVLFPINEWVIIPAWARVGLPVKLEDITDFDYLKCLTPEHKQIAFRQFMRSDLYDGFRPTEVAMAALTLLRERYRVIAVTSPFYQHAGSKWRFCQRAGFEHGDIILCGDKTLVNMDVLLDDRPKTLLALGPGKSMVFDRPWNRYQLYTHHRVYGWISVPAGLDHLLSGAG